MGLDDKEVKLRLYKLKSSSRLPFKVLHMMGCDQVLEQRERASGSKERREPERSTRVQLTGLINLAPWCHRDD